MTNQAKAKAIEWFKGIGYKDDEWIEQLGEGINENVLIALEIALQEMKRENASNLQLALKEQAKEIIEMIDMIPVPESMKGNPKVIWTFAEVNRVIREKYGVKEEGK